MAVPDSFGSWESQQSQHYLEHVEDHDLPMRERLAELQAIDDPDGIHCDEIFLLEEAIANNSEIRMELEEVQMRVERAREKVE